MDVLYDWLLHNVGNEGNYLTVLNTQPHREGDKLTKLDVMARTKAFEVINLTITYSSSLNGGEAAEQTLAEVYSFTDPDQVIAYLSAGQSADLSTSDDQTTFYVSVTKPLNGSDEITFPPQQ